MTVKTLLCLSGVLLAAATPPSPSGVPPVLMSDSHAAMCNVAVGDVFPSLDGLKLGPDGAVVAVVNGDGWMSQQLVADLPGDAAAASNGRRVAAVLIDARTGGQSAAEGVLRIQSTPEGLAVLGTGRWPRVYLLDAQRRVVWFDIEWSISSRRDLRQALEAMLAPQAAP